MSGTYRIGEFAELAGVTVRALHHYDRIGLLKPQRGSSGSRLYRIEDLERLEQIAALKFLGIPLQEIKLLLKHGPLKLTDSLHMQREALTEKRKLIDRAIVAIEAAEKVIRDGQTTDASILRKIIEGIDMQPQENFARKYYTEQAWIERAQLREHWEHAPAEARERWRQAWQQLFGEIEAALDLDPASAAAQALTKRWLQLVESANGGNDGIRAGSIVAWKDRLNWPPEQQDALLAGLGLDAKDRSASMQRLETVNKFIGRAIGHKVQSNLPDHDVGTVATLGRNELKRMHDESIRQYDDMSENYHWLYSDYVLSGALALKENDDVLRSAGQKARILDCSCGIGTLAIPLAKLGFEVSGSDASQGMVEQAILASRNAGLDFPLSCCTWEDLPNRFADPFDLIFCLGNSIGHARGGDEMQRSLKGMRAVLKIGGKLVIQSRDWDHLRKEKIRFTPYPQWRERAGQRCLPMYVWTFPEEFDDAHTIEVVLFFDSGGNVSLRSYPIVYYPFHFEELVERLRCAGFSAIDRFSDSEAEYRVIAS